mgnify:CR=1 FL=1
MKGLLRNNFYSMGANLQLAFGISFVLVFIPLVSGEESIVSMVLAMQSFMFVANSGTALNTDVTSKWSNFEITLPVRRGDILILILCGVFMSAFTSFLTVFVFKKLSADALIFGLSFGVSLSLLTSSFMYPIMLKIGTEKNEIIVFACAGIATALFMVVLRLAAPFARQNSAISAKSLVGIIFALVSIGFFVISYFVSLGIYKRKEL